MTSMNYLILKSTLFQFILKFEFSFISELYFFNRKYSLLHILAIEHVHYTTIICHSYEREIEFYPWDEETLKRSDVHNMDINQSYVDQFEVGGEMES